MCFGIPAKYSKRAYDTAVELGFGHWKYTEYEGMGHSFWIDWVRIEKWLLTNKRDNSPSAITFNSEKPVRAYWAEINEKYNRKKLAKIDIETTSQTINIKITNIADYTLYLKDAPINLSQEITIVENDKKNISG